MQANNAGEWGNIMAYLDSGWFKSFTSTPESLGYLYEGFSRAIIVSQNHKRNIYFLVPKRDRDADGANALARNSSKHTVLRRPWRFQYYM